MPRAKDLNVLGDPLVPCSLEPRTGFYRDGCCSTGSDDLGRHVVCAEMTRDFLELSRELGNDLVTPRPEFGFPGLRPGDRWCVCVERWKEALSVDLAPPVILQATHRAALLHVSLEELQRHAIDVN